MSTGSFLSLTQLLTMFSPTRLFSISPLKLPLVHLFTHPIPRRLYDMYRMKEFNLVTRAGNCLRRIAKIQFGGDGSIYCMFPGLPKISGIAARARVEAKISSTNIDLKGSGRTTSHIVKYSHHPSGNAGFSLTRKVKREINKSSVPLRNLRGHLFSLYVYSPILFKKPKSIHRNPTVIMDMGEMPPAFKIVCHRYPERVLMWGRDGARCNTPPKGIMLADGSTQEGFFVAPPEHLPFANNYLVFYTEGIACSKSHQARLLFLGGFDEPNRAYDLNQATEFLALMYPCSDADALSKAIGSMDFTIGEESR